MAGLCSNLADDGSRELRDVFGGRVSAGGEPVVQEVLHLVELPQPPLCVGGPVSGGGGAARAGPPEPVSRGDMQMRTQRRRRRGRERRGGKGKETLGGGKTSLRCA